ncbi:MAG TPA: carbon storage regulator [Lacipirellulaceae bacterium]
MVALDAAQSQNATATAFALLAVSLSSKDWELIAMLVLSRKTGERIHIGNDITIEVRRVAGNRVTLALDAPRDVRILRGELERAAREFEEPEADTHPAEPYVITHTRPGAVDGVSVHGLGANYAI